MGKLKATIVYFAIASMVVSTLFMLCMFLDFILKRISPDDSITDWLTAIATCVIGAASVYLAKMQLDLQSRQRLVEVIREIREGLVKLNQQVVSTSSELMAKMSSVSSMDINNNFWPLVNHSEKISNDCQVMLSGGIAQDVVAECELYHQKIKQLADLLDKCNSYRLPSLQPIECPDGEAYRLIDELNHMNFINPFMYYMSKP